MKYDNKVKVNFVLAWSGHLYLGQDIRRVYPHNVQIILHSHLNFVSKIADWSLVCLVDKNWYNLSLRYFMKAFDNKLAWATSINNCSIIIAHTITGCLKKKYGVSNYDFFETGGI